MISASTTFTAGAVTQESLLGALARGVGRAALLVRDTAKSYVPVDTGELQDSIEAQEPVLDGATASAAVTAGTDHAFFVEYGTGIRGAASAGAGDGPYSATWQGMPAQPYMRPALDTTREDCIAAVTEDMANAL